MDLVRARLRRLSESLRSLPERLGRSAAVPAPNRRTRSVRQGDGRPPASQHGADYSQAGSSSDSGDTVRQYPAIGPVAQPWRWPSPQGESLHAMAKPSPWRDFYDGDIAPR